MRLADAMALIVPPVDDLKRRALHRPDGETTLFPTLVVLREGRVLAAVTTPRMEATLACAQTVAVGMSPEMLAVAAQATLPDGTQSIAFTTMTEERSAALAVQRYQVHGEQVTFEVPERGEPQDRGIMDRLAAALSLRPLDASAADARTPAGDDEPHRSGAPARRERLDADRGRMVLDSGTCASLQRSVSGIGGTVLYVPSSAAHARSLLQHGMPPGVLLQPPSGIDADAAP